MTASPDPSGSRAAIELRIHTKMNPTPPMRATEAEAPALGLEKAYQ